MKNLYYVMSIPECCSGYTVAMKAALPIYQKNINREGEKLLIQARAIWAAGNNDEAAAGAAALLVEKMVKVLVVMDRRRLYLTK